MINLFNAYNQSSWDLHFSLIKSGYNNTTVALVDDGFLPSDVTSPYLFYTGFANVTEGRPLYYNELEVPATWEIIGNNSSASIYDLGVKKGQIHFSTPTHQRLIKEVDWIDDKGRLSVKDRYNKFGFRFAQTVYRPDGHALQTSYYNQAGQEVLSENHMTGDHILNQAGQFKIFKSKVNFVMNYLKDAEFNLDRIFYNSLATPFLASFYLDRPDSEDVLFWQEGLTDEIPGNMRLILNNSSKKTKIIFQDYTAYRNAQSLLTDEEKKQVSFAGFMYPFKATEKSDTQALILTNSDHIEGLETLVEALPNLNFNIGALTEMSSRLSNFGKYPNVTLYPNITTAQVKQLSETCAFYLDINHHSEILSAVRSAFEHQMVIYAFNETRHSQNFMAAEHVFTKDQADKMATSLKSLIGSETNLRNALNLQLKASHLADAKTYQDAIG